MDKLDGKSMDIVSENIEKLRELFPEVFSEAGKIDFKKLEEELGQFTDADVERYNFTWNGKSEAKQIAQTPSTGTLRPCKEDSKNWDTTQNLYIEGDNLEVLKLLQKSYHKQVKMIYIDPPYNTGKDFVYKDNFHDNIRNYLEITGQVDSEGNKLSTNSDTNGRYHSDWLNMIYPRLKLARNLLRDDGVIFISIDDNEIANLRKVCDEIFGEDNFIAEFVWKRRSGSNDAINNVSIDHEYILCFSKTKESEFIGVYKDQSRYTNPNNDPRGAWAKDNLTCGKTALERPNLNYAIVDPKTGISYYANPNHVWRFEQVKMEQLILDDKVIFPKNADGSPHYKRHLVELRTDRKPYSSIIETVLNAMATKETREILEGQYFNYPKSTNLISQLIKQIASNSDIILDFFSGSATTAHAVMKLNSEDGGSRKFIMVQIPEPTDNKEFPTICEIGKERIRRAGVKIKTEMAKDLTKNQDLDIGFKVLKLDSSNIKAWDSDFDNLETNLLDAVDNIKSDRSPEDLLYEVLLKYGLDLTLPIEEKSINGSKIFVIGFGALIVCLDDHIALDTVNHIAKLKEEYESEITRVVFKDSSFADAVVKTNALQTLKQFGIDEVVSI
jgi:adenine-specific DNA-methyltransferase